jgi:hypothetical protein
VVGNSPQGIVHSYCPPIVINCILWGNGDDLHDCTATYSNISDGDPGEGNISLDPLFVDAPNDDYHLTAGSPVIDAGDNNAPELPNTDKDGNYRIMNCMVDMGAYEYPGDYFTDIPVGFWAFDYICSIYQAGITTGCSQDPLRYCPYNAVNRAQMAAFIVRAVEGEPPANYCSTGSPFSDVDFSFPMCKYIKRLSELGITTGYSDGTYRPALSVNRAQMAAFLVRAVEGEPPANYCDTGSPFTDIDPSFPMCKYIKRLFELGITTGYSDGTYRPTLFVNRTQMAAFLARAFLGME